MMGKSHFTVALLLSCSVSWGVPAYAEAPADQAAQACAHPKPSDTQDDTIASCSAAIESGTLQGQALAAAYAQRGFARTLKRSLDEAESDLDQAVKIAPDFAQGYINRANYWTVRGKPDRALADAEQAVKLSPDLGLAYFVRASAEKNLGQYDRAIADYTEAMRLQPASRAEFAGWRGLSYHKKGDDAHAVEDYSERLKAAPNDVGMILNRGDARRNLKDMGGASADYREAVRLAPQNPGGWKGRGLIRLMTQDFDGAIADLTTAIKLGANESGVYLNRSAAYALKSQNALALVDADMAIRLEPAHPLGYVDRAQTLNSLGDRIAAINSLLCCSSRCICSTNWRALSNFFSSRRRRRN